MGRRAGAGGGGDGAAPHPADEALAALLEDGAGGAPAPGPTDPALEATRRHVAGCPRCAGRLDELRALRVALRDAAGREAAPPPDLAAGALARLRLRQGAVGRLNELVTLLAGVVRGLVTVLAGPPAGRERGPGDAGATRG